MSEKLNIGENGKVWVLWKVKPTDYTEEKQNQIKSLVSKKYGIAESSVKVDPDFTSFASPDQFTALNSTTAEDIQDPKFQQELMKQYIEVYEIQDCDFDEIIKIDSQVNSMMDYSVYDKSKRYRIKWVKWDNFLSYGKDNYLDFTTLKGLVLLKGEPANKSGKSTFAYDLLHFLLFGKINQERAKSNDQMFNNYNKDVNEVVVEGCINIDGEDFIIKRMLTRKAFGKSASQKVYYYHVLQNGDTEELVEQENKEGENTSQTNKIIKEALGLEKDFDLIISANSKDLDELISMGETDRGKILARWIGLSPLEDKEAKAKEIRKKELSKGRYCDLYNRVTLETDIDEKQNKITENKKQIKIEKSHLDEATKKLKEHNTEKDNLLQSKEKIDPSVSRLDMTTLTTKLNNITIRGKSLNSELTKLNEDIGKLKKVEFDSNKYTKINKEKDELIVEIANIKSEIKRLENDNKTLSSQEFCPTCGRKFDNVDNSARINENNETIKKLKEKGIGKETERVNVVNEITKMDTIRDDNAKYSKLELKIMALNSDITSLRTEYTETKTLIGKLEKNKQAILNNNDIDTKINVLKENIRSQENIINTSKQNISTLENEITNYEDKIKENKAFIVNIEKELKDEKNWGLYLKMVGKDGIGKMVLRHSLPIINAELKSLLSDCTDFDVVVSINDSNAVEFSLIRDGITTRLSAASGLERTQAALALRVVLGKMSRLSCPPFILLDEILGTVSSPEYESMKRLYDKIVVMYDFVLHITHLEAIEDWHDMTLTIVKKDNNSSIKPLIIK